MRTTINSTFATKTVLAFQTAVILCGTLTFGQAAAPPKTPQPLASEIARAAVETIKTPDVQAKFRAASVEPVGNSPGEMAAFIAEETRRWSDIIKKNNIVVD